jgi:hypothetical protein
MHFKILFLSQGLELSDINQVVESQLFTSCWNWFHQWLPDSELIQISAFSSSYSRMHPCFTVRKRIWVVWNRHATCGHQKKKTIFTSVVYGQHRDVRRSSVVSGKRPQIEDRARAYRGVEQVSIFTLTSHDPSILTLDLSDAYDEKSSSVNRRVCLFCLSHPTNRGR